MSILEKDGHFMGKVYKCLLNDVYFNCIIGLWYYLSGEELPSLTLVGSSNFG